jgi:SAM-dependent methyltransferase
MGSSASCLDPVIIPLIKGRRVLDVGCGFGRWGMLIRTNSWESYSYGSGNHAEIVGCDGFLPNVEMAHKSGHYHKVYHLLFPPLPFADSMFDTVLIADVIEHMKEEKGAKLIEEAKRVASHRVILSTPNYRALRNAHATMTGWNPLEAHLSYWHRSYLRGRGFRLYGAGWRPGGRYLREGLRKFRLLPFYDQVVRPWLSSVSLYVPLFSENVVGVWEKGNPGCN